MDKAQMVGRETSKLVWVNDNWCPSYLRVGLAPRSETERRLARTEGAVHVKVMLRPGYGRFEPFVRVCAWGADDLGVEMDFEGEYEDLVRKFEEWEMEYIYNIPQCVNIQWFRDRGFKNA